MAVTNRKEVVMRRQAFGWMSAGLVLAAMMAIGCSATAAGQARGDSAAGGAAGGVRSVFQRVVGGGPADGQGDESLDGQAANAYGSGSRGWQGVSRDGRGAKGRRGDGAEVTDGLADADGV